MEEEGVVPPAPIVVVEEEGVVPPPPPIVVVEEEGVVQPFSLPIVVEEDGVVQPPPPPVVEEEGVVPPPPPPLVEEEVVQQRYLAYYRRTTTLARAEHCRRSFATGVDDVISRCEEARLKLQEIVAVLVEVQEPGDAAEILYANLLELVNPGMDSLLPLDPAAKLVDSLFNWPGPLAGAVDVATVLVNATFDSPDPDGGPLQAARRELGSLVHVVHDQAGHFFRLYAATLGLEFLPRGQGAFDFWAAHHDHLDGQGRLALQRLNVAVHTSLTAVVAVGLCSGRPQAGMRVSAAVLTLRQTISEVGEVLVALHDIRRDTLVQLEEAVLNITGMEPLPP